MWNVFVVFVVFSSSHLYPVGRVGCLLPHCSDWGPRQGLKYLMVNNLVLLGQNKDKMDKDLKQNKYSQKMIFWLLNLWFTSVLDKNITKNLLVHVSMNPVRLQLHIVTTQTITSIQQNLNSIWSWVGHDYCSTPQLLKPRNENRQWIPWVADQHWYYHSITATQDTKKQHCDLIVVNLFIYTIMQLGIK